MEPVSTPRVLIVDDDERSLRLLEDVLARDGLHCAAASCAADGLQALRARPGVDVVLSDIYMPAVDGLEFLATARREFAGRPWLQMILITGQASVETAVAAMRLEASDYLIKPADPKQLREAVRHALARAESIRKVRETRPDSPQGRELRQIAAAARELAGELGRGADAVGSAATGLRSLELLQALEAARSSMFGAAVMPEPSWEMLAELMRARLSGRQLTITSLALASKSPTTTALRRIDDLVAGGLATRVPDPQDRRRIHVELTTEGERRMRLFLEGFTRLAS